MTPEDEALLNDAEARVDALFEELSRSQRVTPEEGREFLAIMAAERGRPEALRKIYPNLARFIHPPEYGRGPRTTHLRSQRSRDVSVRAAAHRADGMRELLPRRLWKQADARAASLMGCTAADIERERSNRARRKPCGISSK